MKQWRKLLAIGMAGVICGVSVPMAGMTPGLAITAEEYTGDYTYGDLYYSYLDDGTIEITDCLETVVTVEIPASIEGVAVTSIGYWAFSYCDDLTSITIPDSVTSIGDSAFASCSALTDVYYGGTKEQWAAISIGNYGNENLTDASIHYNPIISTTTTTESTTTTTTTTTPTPQTSSTGTPAFAIYGDVTLDGQVNMADVILLNKAAVGLVDLTQAGAANGDCNANGDLDGGDPVLLMQFQMGEIPSLPQPSA